MDQQAIEERNALHEEIAHLREELALYRNTFQQSALGAYIYQLEDLHDDRTLRMIAANPVVESLTGVAPETIIGRTLDENFPGLRAQGVPQAFAEVVRSGQPFETEQVYGDGRVIESAFAFRAVPLGNNCLAVTFENITQRKQTELALQQLNAELEQRVIERTEALHYNQALLQSLLDNSPAAIYVKDLHGRFLLVNHYTSALLNTTPDQMQQKLDTELFPEAFAMQWRTNEQQALDAGKPISLEETVTQADGLHTFFSIRIPIYNEDGEAWAIGGISTDITERKRQEEQLMMFQTLVENALDAIQVLRAEDAAIIYLNKAHRDMYRCGDRHIGQSIAVIVAEHEQPRLSGIIEEVNAHGCWQGTMTHVRHDGSTFMASESCFAMYDEQGKPNYMVGIVRDISEQVALEQERAALQQQVIETQRHILHELSTPLIPVAEDVLIMPLIGTIDSGRAQQMMETLLEGVASQPVRIAILDITGVVTVDTQVAQTLIQAAQAVKLLGAQVILTGIQPQIAQTLVHLGVDLSHIVTYSSLHTGITYALHREHAANHRLH
ncbi:MAG: PAS domain-containing protein [Chloroflexaceae bacterium]|nr:PAS domain-containing protein [Chloroflexaceae bacterium]